MLEVKAGQKVTRIIGGMPMRLTVTKVTEKTIECGPWVFDRESGAEIDEELCWGPPPLGTGSYITTLP